MGLRSSCGRNRLQSRYYAVGVDAKTNQRKMSSLFNPQSGGTGNAEKPLCRVKLKTGPVGQTIRGSGKGGEEERAPLTLKQLRK